MAKHTLDRCACEEYHELSRRRFLARSAASAIALSVPAWLPRVTYAQAETSRDVLVAIFLRGGADALTLVPPYGDAAYYTMRPTLAIPRPDSTSANRGVDLNGFFGLAESMAALLPVYQSGHLLIVHATGSTHPTRSHFDAQAFMEAGIPGSTNADTGWLGRYLASRPAALPTASLRALGFSYGLPQMLVGGPDTLPIPNPANFGLAGSSSTRTQRLSWIAGAYANERDPLKTAALNTQRTINTLAQLNIGAYVPGGGAVYPNGGFGSALRSTAALIKADIGVEAVAIDLDGWDTHNAQGPLTGGMANLMLTFSRGLAAFHADLFAADLMRKVTLVAMSEFGRVVRENASLGTDHGHGGCLFVLGGHTLGGRVLTQWPGLGQGQLYQNQDLQVTIDYRDILAEIVSKRLGGDRLDLVFPGYTPAFQGIVS